MAEMIHIFIRAYKIKNEDQAEVVYNKIFHGTVADLKKIEGELTKDEK